MSIIKSTGRVPGGTAETNVAAAQCTEARVPLGHVVRQALRARAVPAHLVEQPSGMHFAAFAGHARPSTLGFEPVLARATDGHAVAPGYRTQILAKSGGDIDLGDAPVLVGYRAGGGAHAGSLLCLTDSVDSAALMALEIERTGTRWRAGTHKRTTTKGTPRAGALTAWQTAVIGGDAGYAMEAGDGLRLLARPELGTLTHVGLDGASNRDGRAVLYFADAGSDGGLYRLVTLPKAMSPLDGGTLSVARFETDGTLVWIPLIWGTGPLGRAAGLADAQHLTRETAFAATRVGATPMPGIRDIAVNPANRRLYVLFGDAGAATVLEIMPPENEHAADRFAWHAFTEHERVDATGLATDPAGRLWTVLAPMGAGANATAATLLACDADGPGRGLTQAFLRAPAGARLSAPAFSPDGTAMFLAVHKPHEQSVGRAVSGWPDFTPGVPARAAILAIMRDDGGLIGS